MGPWAEPVRNVQSPWKNNPMVRIPSSWGFSRLTIFHWFGWRFTKKKFHKKTWKRIETHLWNFNDISISVNCELNNFIYMKNFNVLLIVNWKLNLVNCQLMSIATLLTEVSFIWIFTWNTPPHWSAAHRAVLASFACGVKELTGEDGNDERK